MSEMSQLRTDVQDAPAARAAHAVTALCGLRAELPLVAGGTALAATAEHLLSAAMVELVSVIHAGLRTPCLEVADPSPLGRAADLAEQAGEAVTSLQRPGQRAWLSRLAATCRGLRADLPA